MKLLCSEVMSRLDKERSLIVFGNHHAMVKPKDKLHERVIRPLRPLVHKAEKFIFDTGSDQDPRTTKAVRETAVNMLEAKLFHLPFPVIWVEDPYESDPEGLQRNYYLAEEANNRITVRLFQTVNPKSLAAMELALARIPVTFHEPKLIIDLEKPNDEFIVDAMGNGVGAAEATVYGEAIYALKKLIVVLNTKDIILDRVRAEGRRQDTRHRSYDHTVIRVPLEAYDPAEGGDRQAGAPQRRKKHLVSGFVWGKNTRPSEEQRWIFPYWRGDQSVGIVERTHRHVG